MGLLLLLLQQQFNEGTMGWEVHAAVSLRPTFLLEAANEVALRMVAWFRHLYVISSSSTNEHEWLSKHISFVAATRK